LVLVAWVALNATGIVVTPWDPYPHLDRTAARVDFEGNRKAENEVEEILTLLHAQLRLTEALRGEVAALRDRMT
jgi:uncharacterized membrane protein